MGNGLRFLRLAVGALLSILTSQLSANDGVVKSDSIRIPTVAELARPLELSGFQLSPDGKHLLAISHSGDVRTILIWRTESLQERPVAIGSKQMQISSASFVKNDVLAVELVQPYDARLDEVTKIFVRKLFFTDLEGREWHEPLAAGGTVRTEIQSRLNELARPSVRSRIPDDPDHVLIESDGLGRARDLYRYNLRTREASRVMRLSDRDAGVYVDRAGVPYARSRSGSDSGGLFIALDFRNIARGEWEERFKSYAKDREIRQVVWASSKEGRAILEMNENSEFTYFVEYDVASGKVSSPIFKHEFFDAERVLTIWDSKEQVQKILGFAYSGPTGSEALWVDPAVESLVTGIQRALGLKQSEVELVSFDGRRRGKHASPSGASLEVLDYRREGPVEALLKVEGPAHPPDFYLLVGKQLRLLARGKPNLDRRALGSSQFNYYKVRDGVFLPAFVGLPSPELCGPPPYRTVVHPHGGPWSRDFQSFDRVGWVPLLTSRCIAVVQPQFRGSANWGRSLWRAGDEEWGQKMQDDKDDGARWMVSQGIADPKRIAMLGFSYGGYAAFVASIRPTDIYQCAISGAGVSDLDRIGNALFSNPYFRVAQEPTMRGVNPVKRVAEISIPLMVYHGDRDQTVPLTQSTTFVEQAVRMGKPVQYRELRDFGHGFSWRESTRAEHLQLIEDFLLKGCRGNQGL